MIAVLLEPCWLSLLSVDWVWREQFVREMDPLVTGGCFAVQAVVSTQGNCGPSTPFWQVFTKKEEPLPNPHEAPER